MKDVGRVERSFTGWVIGLRRWSLKAYDEKGDLIYEIHGGGNNNYITYVKFLTQLRQTYGYDLTLVQRRYIKSEPFIFRNFKTAVKKHHIIAVAGICGYTEKFLVRLKTKHEDVQLKFAWDIYRVGTRRTLFYFERILKK